MEDNLVSDYSRVPATVQTPKPTPVSDEKWVGTVQAFTKILGAPKLLKSGAAARTVEEADEAKWGKGESGVDLVRGQPFAPAGGNIFLQANSVAAFDALINDFKHLGLKVKDPVNSLVVYRKTHSGLIKTEVITFGSFYLNEDKVNIGNSDVVGAVEVGHNPPPRSAHSEQ